MSKLIKIYGERNTNTNYLSKLIKLNLSVQEVAGTVPPTVMKLQNILPGNELVRDIYFYLTFGSNLGWKHTRVKPLEILKKYSMVKRGLGLVTITKNPYSWLMSLYRRPYHQYYHEKPDFETFLQLPWTATGRDNTERVLKNPIENMEYKKYFISAAYGTKCVKHNDREYF